MNSLSHQFVRAFSESIVRQALPPGTPIPSETELAGQYGVSRTVVREGMRELSALGLITKHQGRCSRVAPRYDWDLLNPGLLAAVLAHDSDSSQIREDVFDFRMVIECYAVGCAALRRQPDDLARMHEQLAIMEDAVDDPKRFMEADNAMHNAIQRAADNLVVSSVLRMIQELLTTSRRFTTVAANQSEALGQHRAMVAAVEAGDPDAAREAMRLHLLWSRDAAELDFGS
jgi:DNA-binding FadR family transcriptional regulator